MHSAIKRKQITVSFSHSCFFAELHFAGKTQHTHEVHTVLTHVYNKVASDSCCPPHATYFCDNLPSVCSNHKAESADPL